MFLTDLPWWKCSLNFVAVWTLHILYFHLANQGKYAIFKSVVRWCDYCGLVWGIWYLSVLFSGLNLQEFTREPDSGFVPAID